MKKNGFTLVELLAVLVILAVISLIAIPKVADIKTNSSNEAIILSAKNYVRGLEKQIMEENIDGSFDPSSCTIVNGDLTCDSRSISMTVDGNKPTSADFVITDYKVISARLVINGITVNYEDGVYSIQQ